MNVINSEFRNFGLLKARMMKKYLLIFSVFTLLASCSSNGDELNFVNIQGSAEESFTIDWRNLPLEENISLTTSFRTRKQILINTSNFDIQNATQILDPSISALFYDIKGWNDINSVGILSVTISVIADNGFPQNYTNFTVNELQNTITRDNSGQDVLAKEVVYNGNEGIVDLNGLFLATQLISRGSLILEVEVAGRNVELLSSPTFEIVLSMGLSALATTD